MVVAPYSQWSQEVLVPTLSLAVGSCPGPDTPSLGCGLTPPSARRDPRQLKGSWERHGAWKVVFSLPKLGSDSHVDDK